MLKKQHSLALKSDWTASYSWLPRTLWRWSILIGLVLLAAGVFFFPYTDVHAATTPNMNCTLIVPPDPLSAQGLATPYQLTATNPANGPCNEANVNQAAFVQGAIFSPVNARIFVYNPLVIDVGTQPAVRPIVPQLPIGSIVALWFGFNGNVLTLQGTDNSLQQGHCVNGLDGSNFGQFAYCNAPTFFNAANGAIQTGRLLPPPVGTARDGKPCPTVRDFSVVDQDQSDNVLTTYIITANGLIAQNNMANGMALRAMTTVTNASDNRLLAVSLDGALGCTPWMVPNLDDNGIPAPALPLNELQAAVYQAPPVALVPLGDPMTKVNNQPNLQKVNSYRVGVDQPIAYTPAQASTITYCKNILNIAPARLQLDSPFTRLTPSPAATANSLFTFLAQRLSNTLSPNGLNCTGLLNIANPVTLITNGNGVVVNATFAFPSSTGVGTGTGIGTSTGVGNGNGTSTNTGVSNGNGNGIDNGTGIGNGNGMGTSIGNGNGMGISVGLGTGPCPCNDQGNGNNNGMSVGFPPQPPQPPQPSLPPLPTLPPLPAQPFNNLQTNSPQN